MPSRTLVAFRFSFFAFLLLSACTREADTRPLLEAGMEPTATRQLRELKVTDPEVAQFVSVRKAGFSDAGCVELLRIQRPRGKPFDDGANVAGLVRSGVKEATILELARLDQLGLWAGEYELLHMAGMSDALLLTLARRRADGLPTVSGASLTRLKNAGISEATLIELARRGISDDDAKAIYAQRRRGTSEPEILRRYPAQISH